MTGFGALHGSFENAALVVFGVPNVTYEVAQREGAWMIEGAAEAGVAASLLFWCGVYRVRREGGRE